MTPLQEFEATLARRRAANEQLCKCGHPRDAHFECQAGCYSCRSPQCLSFVAAKTVAA